MNHEQLRWSPIRQLLPNIQRSEFDENRILGNLQRNPSDERPTIVLSDLDGTLCDTYTFDPETNNHQHAFDPEILTRAQEVPIVVATQRRAKHSSLPELWNQGLVHPGLPIIAENGGVVVIRKPDNSLGFDRLAPKGTFELARDWLEDAEHNVLEVPEGLQLAVKPGDTMLIARLQNEMGQSLPADQEFLLEQLQSVDLPSGLTIVSSGDSLCIQHESVDKGRGFHRALGWLGLERSDVLVIGLGNGLNDEAIFRASDLSVGVSIDVSHLVDVAMIRGPESAKTVLSQTPHKEFVTVPADITDIKDDRFKIDVMDAHIAVALGTRFRATDRIGLVKAIMDIDPVDPVREEEKLADIERIAVDYGAPPELARALLRSVIDVVVQRHHKQKEDRDV